MGFPSMDGSVVAVAVAATPHEIGIIKGAREHVKGISVTDPPEINFTPRRI